LKKVVLKDQSFGHQPPKVLTCCAGEGERVRITDRIPSAVTVNIPPSAYCLRLFWPVSSQKIVVLHWKYNNSTIIYPVAHLLLPFPPTLWVPSGHSSDSPSLGCVAMAGATCANFLGIRNSLTCMQMNGLAGPLISQ
jgi:hypothetical protein